MTLIKRSYINLRFVGNCGHYSKYKFSYTPKSTTSTLYFSAKILHIYHTYYFHFKNLINPLSNSKQNLLF